MLNVVTIKISSYVFSESVKRRVTGSSTFVVYPEVVSGCIIGIQEEQCFKKSRVQNTLWIVESREENQ